MSPFVCRATLFSASFACLLLLSACGKQEAAPAPSPAPTTSPIIAPSTPTAPTPAHAATAKAPATVPSASVSTAAPVPATDASAPIAVVKLTLGDVIDASSHEVTRPSHTFAANTKIIYASVTTSGRTMDATLNAKWSYLEGRGQLVSSISQSIATTGPATTTFKVQNPDLWPEGKYEVDISLDGKSVIKQSFVITKS
ncbi:MAG: hypothetical protein ABI114_02455 [Rhodanobacter sp.]